ncbi:similar to Saccharomyces cerevisiae YGL094C PAN2 Essential subunit of the Pan2p-Pan3p poly(A)-ribonuclease complex [Maudiozyma saulgeensis]|uniref:Similar to Saccharomyces cerevisiae YGL094C PAN2 Essential subunit of the Pan2p-Pan3p poly(A)-ribonuclease complex n=1 Tax=Maudiozyma saulgeensis TaxID=1789683 RepID=A0A1X7R028_9SACH|nr:similar to Saccharomyces cerevisiae YGL094C PAN2 Essential subunit of the Pan2p-Pan3p poly(A)-ribonuclease complex [Kazachstania saulgeensis]
MNNWQHLFNNTADLSVHLKKPYFRYDNKEKEVTNLVFDDRANLIWAGDTYGCMTAYNPNFQMYSRYKAHIGNVKVNDILTTREGVLSLSDDSLHMSNRRGVTLFNLTCADVSTFSGLRTMCTISPENETQIYCAGDVTSSGITGVDLNKAAVSNLIHYPNRVKFMKSNSKLITIGQQSGKIDLLDHNSNQIIKSFNGHSETISSIDVRGHTLITTGTSRRFTSSFADPFVNVYDLRIMRQLTPISFSKGTTMGSGGADFAELHPVLPTVMIVGSYTGSFDFIDLSNPALRTQYVHPGQEIRSLKISPNGNYMSVLEVDNHASLWSRTMNTPTIFTNTQELLEYPDFADDKIYPIPVPIDDEEFPLSSIGLPYYHERLLSAWSPVVFDSDGTIPKHIEQESLPLSSGKQVANKTHLVLQGLNLSSKEFPFHKYNKDQLGARNEVPKYVSLKDERRLLSLPINKDTILEYKTTDETRIPNAYSKLPFTSGKFGSDNFDFDAFNKTEHAGLDTDIDNLYTNAILQVYRFVPEIYNFVVGCLKDENFEVSLLLQLGYLYDMMGRSKNRVCRSTNFQVALNALPEAEEAGVIESSPKSIMFDGPNSTRFYDTISRSLAQKFNKFLLSRLQNEEFQNNQHNITLQQCIGLDLNVQLKRKCRHDENRNEILSSLTLMSPARNGMKTNGRKSPINTILSYIESSMKRVYHVENICDKCSKKDIAEVGKIATNLPPVLSFELLLTDSEWQVAKKTPNWLSKSFFATMTPQGAFLRNTSTELKQFAPIFKYDLSGYVARITDPSGSSRLVTYSKIYDSNTNTFKWYLFNNYLVVEIDEEEALNASQPWKCIEIVVYCDSEEIRKPFFSVDTYQIDRSILFRDHFAAGIRETKKKEYTLLTQKEAPKAGTLIAIDAEFVTLNNELNEIDCKGMKTVIKSKKTALARLSIVRGEEGEEFGKPFIDDYVVNTNRIEDYLTKFSGIEPGDLDPVKSDKTLVTLEVIYRKVWLLMQLGCVFVGHGLSNDFKHININVPKEQIRDTAVYFLQGKRFLSLRYLAFVLLGQNIQEGNHDSIEDAYTALILYKRYLVLKENGSLKAVIDSLYEEGRATNYRVPESNNKITK